MRMVDLIQKKKHGLELSEAEWQGFVKGYTDGEIPDYQVSAFLMACWFKGLTAQETSCLTLAMASSGDTIDLSHIAGHKVDKHSTGGVGDKTTLIIAPIVAAMGVPVAKMSGRGLGHTGGTIDKLESIPGFKTEIANEEFFAQVREHGIVVAAQTGNLAPADKKLYALRDVTATVDSLPLIAASVMSKKIASGADSIVLDVKIGSGAFMKTVEDAVALGSTMVSIGTHVGRKVVALISSMECPLGHAVGNASEVKEAVLTLEGKGPSDLLDLCLELASNMAVLAGVAQTFAEGRSLAQEMITSGKALAKLREMVIAQGGDVSYIDDTSKLPEAPLKHQVLAPKSGYIARMNTEAIGMVASILGAGRLTKTSLLDLGAGLVVERTVGDYVEAGTCVATLFTSKEATLNEANTKYLEALEITDKPVAKQPLVLARVDETGTTYFN